MTTLKEIQGNFINDCLSGELTESNISIEKDIDTGTISAKGRMGIYRESAIANITMPLQMIYPVTEDLLGKEFFQQTCRQYIQKHWPTSGNMDYYGESFADFLNDLTSVRHLPYLYDMAKLEWLFHISALADDKKTEDWSNFSNLAPDELTNTIINIHPSVQLISSKHPLLKIWEMCKNTEKTEGNIDLSKENGGNILLVRKDLKVDLYPLADNETAFIHALINGSTLLNAYKKAIDIEENNEIQHFILKHITIGTFYSYMVESNT